MYFEAANESVYKKAIDMLEAKNNVDEWRRIF